MSFLDTLKQHQETVGALSDHVKDIEQIAECLIDTFENNKKLMWAGNGGSAADAQHMSAELVVRFRKNRRALPSIALNTDTSTLTACSNDFGYEELFARQVEALGNAGDALILLSTSGNSENCIKAALLAKEKKICVIVLTGSKESQLSRNADMVIHVPSADTARIQEAHALIAHWWCQKIEESIRSTAK